MSACVSKISEEFQSVRFLTILSDTSTDASIIEQEIVLLQFARYGVPKTKMAASVNIDHADAEWISTLFIWHRISIVYL